MNWFEKMVQETEEEREDVTGEQKTPIRPRPREETEEHRILSTDDIPSYRPIPLYENERWPGNRHRPQRQSKREPVQYSEKQTTKRVVEEREQPTPSRAFRPSEVPSPIFGMRKKPEMPELSKKAREARAIEKKGKGKSTSDITQIEQKLTSLHEEKGQLQETEVKKALDEPIEEQVFINDDVEVETVALSDALEEDSPEVVEREEATEEVEPVALSDALEEDSSEVVEREETAEEVETVALSDALEEDSPEVVEREEATEEVEPVALSDALEEDSSEVVEREETAEEVETVALSDALEEPSSEVVEREETAEEVETVALSDALEEPSSEVVEREEATEEVTEDVKEDDEEESTLPFNVLMLSSDKRKFEMAEKIKRARRNV